ncbi:MAG: hypothetical protein FWG98_14110 [Candidatus Cloacimonetes bacterium]|nr:hypothetical protein [Candidatus Cloacimonadota bacterium]
MKYSQKQTRSGDFQSPDRSSNQEPYKHARGIDRLVETNPPTKTIPCRRYGTNK